MARGSGFSIDETNCLLDSIEEILPIDMDEWSLVERRHQVAYPDRNRTKESLRRKFQSLYLVKKATGDPTYPPEVRRAKALQQAIREKAEVSSAGSESSEGVEVVAEPPPDSVLTGSEPRTDEEPFNKDDQAMPRTTPVSPTFQPWERCLQTSHAPFR